MRTRTRPADITALYDDIKDADTGTKRDTVRRNASEITTDLEAYIDRALDGPLNFITEDKRPLGLATTVFYEQHGFFKDEYLEHIPWVGYAATVRDGALQQASIGAPRAFVGAYFKPGAGESATWKGTRQAHHTYIATDALPGTLIMTDHAFKNAWFEPGAAPNSVWFGHGNAYGASIPADFVEETISKDRGEENFAFTSHVAE